MSTVFGCKTQLNIVREDGSLYSRVEVVKVFVVKRKYEEEFC